MSAQATARLLTEVLIGLRPHLPDDPDIEITPHRKWTTLQRTDLVSDHHGRPQHGSISGITVRSLRPWVPLLSRNLRRRLTAQSAVETVLDIAYQGHDVDEIHEPRRRFAASFDFEVKAIGARDGIVVSFQPPKSQSRIELPAIPFSLL